MFHIEAPLSEADIAKMTFSERISTAKDLAKSYGLTIFVVLLAGTLLINMLGIVMTLFVDFSIFKPSDQEFTAARIIRFIPSAALFLMVIGFISQLFALGVNTLVLYYIDANEPYSIFSVVMEPWANLGSVFLSLLLWLGLFLVLSIIVGLLALVPILGPVLALVVISFFFMAMYLACFHIADKVIYRDEELTPAYALLAPISMIKSDIKSWMKIFAVIVAAALPAVLIVAFGAFRAYDGNPGWTVICFLAAIVYSSVVAVFVIFFVALSYRQSMVRQIYSVSR